MTEKKRTKKYDPTKRNAKHLLLIRKINDMMPVPDVFMTEIVLNLSLRLTLLKSAKYPFDDKNREELRHLVADMALTARVVQKLALLFANPEPVLQMADDAIEVLQRLADCYKNQTDVDADDLDMLKDLLDVYHDMMKQTRLDEYKKAVEAATVDFKV